MNMAGRTILVIDAAPFCGGAQESLWCWGKAMRKAGERLILLTADNSPGGLAARAASDGWEMRTFACRHWRKSPAGLWQMIQDTRNFAWQSRLWRREFSPSIVYANGWRAGGLWLHSPWKELPCLLQDRDLQTPALIRRHLARFVQGVVGATDCVLKPWQAVLPAERCRMLPNGFDLAWLREQASGVRESDEFTAVLVADFVPWKNHRLFLEALAALRAEGMQAQGVIVGRCHAADDSVYLQSLQDYARRLGLEPNIRWLTDGSVSGVSAIVASSVLVSCALEESFGRTVIEALALGKPVVAVSGGGVQEILAGCPAATLCAGTPEALATALAGWRDRMTRLAVAEAARSWAERYEMSRLVRAWQQVLDC